MPSVTLESIHVKPGGITFSSVVDRDHPDSVPSRGCYVSEDTTRTTYTLQKDRLHVFEIHSTDGVRLRLEIDTHREFPCHSPKFGSSLNVTPLSYTYDYRGTERNDTTPHSPQYFASERRPSQVQLPIDVSPNGGPQLEFSSRSVSPMSQELPFNHSRDRQWDTSDPTQVQRQIPEQVHAFAPSPHQSGMFSGSSQVSCRRAPLITVAQSILKRPPTDSQEIVISATMPCVSSPTSPPTFSTRPHNDNLTKGTNLPSPFRTTFNGIDVTNKIDGRVFQGLSSLKAGSIPQPKTKTSTLNASAQEFVPRTSFTRSAQVDPFLLYNGDLDNELHRIKVNPTKGSSQQEHAFATSSSGSSGQDHSDEDWEDESNQNTDSEQFGVDCDQESDVDAGDALVEDGLM